VDQLAQTISWPLQASKQYGRITIFTYILEASLSKVKLYKITCQLQAKRVIETIISTNQFKSRNEY